VPSDLQGRRTVTSHGRLALVQSRSCCVSVRAAAAATPVVQHCRATATGRQAPESGSLPRIGMFPPARLCRRRLAVGTRYSSGAVAVHLARIADPASAVAHSRTCRRDQRACVLQPGHGHGGCAPWPVGGDDDADRLPRWNGERWGALAMLTAQEGGSSAIDMRHLTAPAFSLPPVHRRPRRAGRTRATVLG
jgi:hypothetical protein